MVEYWFEDIKLVLNRCYGWLYWGQARLYLDQTCVLKKSQNFQHNLEILNSNLKILNSNLEILNPNLITFPPYSQLPQKIKIFCCIFYGHT